MTQTTHACGLLLAGPPVAFQETVPPQVGTYVWLAAGAVIFALVLAAFVYLLVRRHWGTVVERLDHPALGAADRWLAGRTPRLWRFVRRRFSVHAWHGLAVTATALFVFAAGYLFALISESWIDEDALYAVDRRVHEWLAAAGGGRLTEIMRVVSRFGDGETIAAAGLLLTAWLLYRRLYWKAVALVLSVGVGAGVMFGLKEAFGRSRPGELPAAEFGHSFPSGHALMATVFYGFVIYLTWRLSRSDAVRLAVSASLTLLVFLVGVSRVVLARHWVSDVAGGFTAGLAWLVLSLVATRALRAYRSSRPRPGGSSAEGS